MSRLPSRVAARTLNTAVDVPSNREARREEARDDAKLLSAAQRGDMAAFRKQIGRAHV